MGLYCCEEGARYAGARHVVEMVPDLLIKNVRVMDAMWTL